MAGVVDWVAKERVFDAYRERHGLEWGDARLRAMDIQYHDLRDDRSLFDRLGLERLCTDEEVERAVTEPPTTTRAYFRGRCLQKWPERHRGRQLGLAWCSTSAGTRSGGCR